MTLKLRLASALVCAAALWAQDPNQTANIDPNQPESQDPPARVARLGIIQGQVSFQPATVNEWTAATLNYPVTIGDHLFADNDSRAELQVGSTAIRLGSLSALSFLNLDDRLVQIRLDEGATIIRIQALEQDEAYEIDTAQGAITLLQPGEYRIDTDPERNATMVTVRRGDASVNTNSGTFSVRAQQTAYFAGDGQPQFATENPVDAFDQFSIQENSVQDQMPAPRYVSQDMPGWQDLERNGQWSDDREYGPVWRPRAVAADWQPYRYGHWAWVEPWGWTWIDDAPWGFAPFHYGRWAIVGGSWGWIPGPVGRRPVYAPALVAFVGGGGVTAVAWFPLGPREVFVPGYHVSPHYVNRVNYTTVNIMNVRVVNRTYVNRTYVTAVDHQSFAGARPVYRSMVSVPRDYASRGQITVAAQVTPGRMSVMGHAGAPVNVPRPNARYMERPVYAQRTPPPAPVPFTARQRALEANPGRPVDRNTMEQLRTTAPTRQPSVRTLPPSTQTNNPQGTQFGRPTNNRPFDRTTNQSPADQNGQQQQQRRNRPDTNTTAPTNPVNPPADPQQRRNRPDFNTPTPTPTNPVNPPADQQQRRNRPDTNTTAPTNPVTPPVEQPQQRRNRPETTTPIPTNPVTPPAEQQERRQRNRPEAVAPAPAPATPAAPVAQPERRPRPRPEAPAATPTPAPTPRPERPAAREEKPAPKHEKKTEKKEEK